MAKPKKLSGRAFAKLDGCAAATVQDALRKGLLVADSDGRLNPGNKINRAWLARSKQPARRSEISVAARLEQVTARAERAEFELAVWQAFYIDRAPLADWLHCHADCLLAALRAFPGDEIELRPGEPRVPRYVPLLWPEADGWPVFTRAARAAMNEHIHSLGDVHRSIEFELDEAGAAWRGCIPEPPKGTELDVFKEPPETIVEGERRRVAAVAALERQRIAVRRAELLASPPAERAVGKLVLGWRQSVVEQFGVRSSAILLSAMSRQTTHEAQWQLFRALQDVLRGIVRMAEHAAGGEDHMAHTAMQDRFRPVIGMTLLRDAPLQNRPAADSPGRLYPA